MWKMLLLGSKGEKIKMEKQYKIYTGIDPRKALAAILITLGLFIGSQFQEKGQQRRRMETYSSYIKGAIQEQLDLEQNPLLKDVNNDGLADLVLKLKSGEDLVLYRTNKGYEFEDPMRR